MASRKTYFGIGWPKDPSDRAPTLPDANDREDDRKDDGPSGEHSAPTVVDDEKVAEGLAQLRSWYQSDAPGAARPAATSMPAAPQSEPPGARPTTVGHASSQQAMPPRPLAPDPMRATMFGHDIHRFDFEAASAAPELPPVTSSPPIPDRGAANAGPSPNVNANANDAPPRRPEPTPRAAEWDSGGAQPDAFRLADYLRRQAAQPHQAAARWVASRDTVPVRTNRGLPLLVFAIGFVALAVALLLSVLSRDNPSSGPRPPAPAPAPPLGSALDRPPGSTVPGASPTLERTREVTPPRPVEKAVAKPHAERQAVKRVESSAPSLLAKPKNRAAPVKSDPESRDDASESTPTEARQPDEGAASTAPAAPAEAERPAPRARPSEPTRPRKREKSAPLQDADSTLPPSADE